MNLNKLLGTIILIMFSSVMLAGIAFAAPVPVTVDEVLVNGDEIAINDLNRLNIERGEEIEIKVILTAFADTDNVQVEAEINGYEYDDKEETSDLTHVFDVEENVTYRKKLTVSIPSNADEDDYKLRITITNRNDESISQNFNLKIDAPRHSMAIRDIILNPSENVEAGRAVLAAVRVKNMGDRDEDSVKVTVRIPGLGLKASEYIDEVDDGDSETSEELFLPIPSCAEAKDYEVIAEVEYDDGHESVTESTMITVVDSGVCTVDDEEEEEEEVVDEEEDNDAGFVMDTTATEDDDEQEKTNMLRKVLEIALIALIVILVIIGLIIGLAGLGKGSEF